MVKCGGALRRRWGGGAPCVIPSAALWPCDSVAMMRAWTMRRARPWMDLVSPMGCGRCWRAATRGWGLVSLAGISVSRGSAGKLTVGALLQCRLQQQMLLGYSGVQDAHRGRVRTASVSSPGSTASSPRRGEAEWTGPRAVIAAGGSCSVPGRPQDVGPTAGCWGYPRTCHLVGVRAVGVGRCGPPAGDHPDTTTMTGRRSPGDRPGIITHMSSVVHSICKEQGGFRRATRAWRA